MDNEQCQTCVQEEEEEEKKKKKKHRRNAVPKRHRN